MRMRIRRGVFAAWWAFALIVAPTGVSAVTVTLDSTIHGQVGDLPRDGTPDNLLNTRLFITNAISPTWTALYRPIIEFDISGWSAPLTMAQLSLTGIGPGISASLIGSHQVDVYGYTGDGLLALSDWYEVGSLVTSFNYTQASSNTIVTLDVTSFINAQIAASANWAGFLLDLPVVTGNAYAEFGNSVATFPDLIVESAVPLPTALPLFGTGLAVVGLLGWRRKRKAAAAA